MLWLEIAIVVAVVSCIACAYIAHKYRVQAIRNMVTQQALTLMLRAEKSAVSGEQKMQAVILQLSNTIPDKYLCKVVGEHKLGEWLQNLYNKIVL